MLCLDVGGCCASRAGYGRQSSDNEYVVGGLVDDARTTYGLMGAPFWLDATIYMHITEYILCYLCMRIIQHIFGVLIGPKKNEWIENGCKICICSLLSKLIVKFRLVWWWAFSTFVLWSISEKNAANIHISIGVLDIGPLRKYIH